MHKITFPANGFLLLFFGFILIPLLAFANEKKPNVSNVFKHSQKHLHSIFQDKNLAKGNWQKEGTAVELHITELLKNGGLQVSYSNSKLIFIEKAGWSESSDILRVFVLFSQDDKSGYSLALNYDAKKDVLRGVYVDGSDDKSYNVIFNRIK